MRNVTFNLDFRNLKSKGTVNVTATVDDSQLLYPNYTTSNKVFDRILSKHRNFCKSQLR